MNGLDLTLVLAVATVLLMAVLGGTRVAGWLGTLLYGAQLYLLVGLGASIKVGGSVASAFGFSVLGHPVGWALSGLGWFFALVTLGAAFFSTWFASGAWGAAARGARLLHTALAVNVLAMLLLLSSADLLGLFIGWELVSWASFLLMAAAGGEALRAAYRYIVYAMAGGMAVLAGTLLLQVHAGGFDFAAAAAAFPTLSPALKWLVAALFFAGYGVKMALVPFHLWQSAAYALTPGPGAAFLGAISSRMGLFAMLVVLWQVIGLEQLAQLRALVPFVDFTDLMAVVAAVTIVAPTFIALTQNDARMLLAWHGIGQGGYMLLGVVLGSSLGVSGGLLHVFNHASYQAPLFLAVTAVLYRTGTADLDRLGGLINRMPLSFVTMLLGIIGLAGLPPMNGFVSKWMVYQALLEAHRPLLFIAAVIGTLGTILSVYKLIHNMFLGQLRSEHATVREVPWSMSVPMLLMGVLAFVTGFMPGLALDYVAAAQEALGVAPLAYHLGGVSRAAGSLNMLWVVGVLLAAIGVGALIFLSAGRSHRTHQLDNYAGGHFLSAEIRYQYSHDFYAGLMRVIRPWYRGSVQWLEQGLVGLAHLLGSMMHGLYRTAYTPLYALVLAVLALWAVAAGYRL